MQYWKELYLEHAQIIKTKMPQIRWFDLWHNQVNFLTEAHPFPTPAVFATYRSSSLENIGQKTQRVVLQVDFYVYYETFSDTYDGSHNQQSALNFIDLIDKVHAAFHGSSGANYSQMQRTSFAPVDTGNAGNLYRITFRCNLVDNSAEPLCELTEQANAEICIDKPSFDLN